MSKSVGNVIDPLDVAGQYGSDALRLALATGTAPGQDLNLSLERVVAARNFTNKLWNAARLVLASIADADAGRRAELAAASFVDGAALSALPLPERWIVTRLHECAAGRPRRPASTRAS